MKKIIKTLALILLVVFIGVPLIPTERNQSDCVPKADFLTVDNTPDNIGKFLQVACYDCNSNNMT